MTIGELIARLQRIVALNPSSADMPVTFGKAMEPVAGGIVGKYEGRATLNLAPVTLDRIGGF